MEQKSYLVCYKENNEEKIYDIFSSENEAHDFIDYITCFYDYKFYVITRFLDE